MARTKKTTGKNVAAEAQAAARKAVSEAFTKIEHPNKRIRVNK